ncbi:ABC transporter permease subunit [Mesobacillus zeae]|uniref:ABC transporter n=1 Tax=Mesobacillus zeae TaxID=1917180 RepID=A0A398BH32_9BACI|nr:ABC transporter permease subunit [Mesobacillus zeae]RID86783.1 ABC transporter [Mesobacillus zeae]
MNLFWREMKANRKSLTIWSIGMVILIGSSMSKYAGFSASDQSVNSLMADMPDTMKAVMGIGDFDLATASGYYGLLFLYLILMGTAHAGMLGANILAKEERDRTAEFLFVKPVSRGRIMMLKLAAAVTNVSVFNLVTLSASSVFFIYFGEDEHFAKDLLILMVGMLLLQLLFLSIGMLIAALLKRPGKSGALSGAILLIAFVLSVAVNLKEELSVLKYVTPFQYFDAHQLMETGFDPVFTGLSVSLTALFLLLAFRSYNRKDLNG